MRRVAFGGVLRDLTRSMLLLAVRIPGERELGIFFSFAFFFVFLF